MLNEKCPLKDIYEDQECQECGHYWHGECLLLGEKVADVEEDLRED